MNTKTTSALERYCAPMCEELVLDSETVVCTSLTGDTVDPGTGLDWGNF